MDGYGVGVYPRGVELHTDGRFRRRDRLGVRTLESPFPKGGGPRGQIRGFTKESRRRLAWVLANAPTDFASHLTVTYHARVDEADGAQVKRRNRALVQRAKTDMNRFLAVIGKEAGRYVWIQEFQKRGAIHFHVLLELAVDARRLSVAWCRATGQIHDPHALEQAARVRAVEDQTKARKYLIKYFGKGKQKQLPAGVDRAGRYWGASRSLRVGPLAEVVTCPNKHRHHEREALLVARSVRRYVSKAVGFKFRGGRLISWDGGLSERLVGVVKQLRAFYRDSGYIVSILEPFWEVADPEVEIRRARLESTAVFKSDWV